MEDFPTLGRRCKLELETPILVVDKSVVRELHVQERRNSMADEMVVKVKKPLL